MDGARGGSVHQYKRGLWTKEEDKILMEHIEQHGKGQWNRIPKKTGLNRCGKSCRLRWVNYLSPNVKKGSFSEEEEDLIIRLHKLLGNRWSLIAGRVPGRTDNQVKNYWNTHLSKRNGCAKKQRTEQSCTQNPDSKSPKECQEKRATSTLPSLAAFSGNTVSKTTEESVEEDSITKNKMISDALIPHNTEAFVADGENCTSSFAWRDRVDHQMSNYQNLVQLSDEFLQFDFGWGNIGSLFSD